jgi:hypothetical protein
MPNTNLNQTALDPSMLVTLPQRLRDNLGGASLIAQEAMS